MVSRTCPTREELRAYSLGLVSPAGQVALSRHVWGCSECLGTLVELESEVDPLLSAVSRASLQPAAAKLLGDEAVYHQGLTRTMALAGAAWVNCAASGDDEPEEARAGTLGQYELLEELGRGGMGIVYKARHIHLDKVVALKILYRSRLARADDVDRFLREMKAVGRLDHPNIVRATDAGEVDGAHYLVMEFVSGTNLSQTLRDQNRLSIKQSVEVVRDAARGLQHAHQRGLVHRDVKPSNILLANSGKARITDFGLVLAANDVFDDLAYAGTPAYMSPEQARGEGHRVDGRSDIFSLGAVFYRLLTGQQPFEGPEIRQLCEQIVSADVARPRIFDPNLPEELERICLKALAKEPSRRYVSAGELADDLDSWLCGQERLRREKPVFGAVIRDMKTRGLYPYLAEDAGFFLDLVPGPRDSSRLPISIRFWKRCIERSAADESFRVGVLRGPNGCGKSSFVCAGLLPNLGRHVTSIYLVATGRHTEEGLTAKLRKSFSSIPDDFDLLEVLAEVKHRVTEHPDAKVLIVLDQFEQWLQVHQDFEATLLADALQLCDGRRIQCLLIVRDELWASTTRLMEEINLPLKDGVNCASIDLLNCEHARDVLAAYGRACGALPDHLGDQSSDNIRFLDESIAGLAEGGVVSPFRLTMFAETVKNVLWTPAKLHRMGGVHGVCVAFLSAAFGATSMGDGNRRHRQAARAVLGAICPGPDETLREKAGHYRHLLEISGYSASPKEFDELLSILNHRLKLVSLVDPEALSEVRDGTILSVDCRCYQLSHAYLAPIVREWTGS